MHKTGWLMALPLTIGFLSSSQANASIESQDEQQ